MGGSRGNAAREERKDGEEVEFYKGDSLSVLQNLSELIWVGLLKVDQAWIRSILSRKFISIVLFLRRIGATAADATTAE